MKYRIKVPKNKNRQKRNSGKVTRVMVVGELHEIADTIPTAPVFATKQAAEHRNRKRPLLVKTCKGRKKPSIPRYNTKTLAQRIAMIKRASDVYSSIYNNEGQELMNAINVLKKRNVTA